MNIGVMAYTTQSGLGILAREFYRHGIVQRILALPHPRYEPHNEWYAAKDLFNLVDKNSFLEGLDVLLLLENAWYWQVPQRAVKQGIPIVIVPMYEYSPKPLPVPAHLYLCPSLLDYRVYQDQNAAYLPIPVEKPWRLRERAEVFVHNAGHGGKDYRNGTPELLEAMKLVKSPVKLIVRGQPSEPRVGELFARYQDYDSRVEFRLGDLPEETLWEEGDAFIFPETYNGLCLPLQEAYASGMLVMASGRFPNTEYLPLEPLIPVQSYIKKHLAIDFDCAVIEPREIARMIDAWYGADIRQFSYQGQAWAQRHSWEVLKPRYLDLFTSLLCQTC